MANEGHSDSDIQTTLKISRTSLAHLRRRIADANWTPEDELPEVTEHDGKLLPDTQRFCVFCGEYMPGCYCDNDGEG